MSTVSRSRALGKRLDLGCAGIRMTPQEFDAIRRSDPRFRYELIAGRLVLSRMPSIGEVGPNQELGYYLLVYWDTHPEGSILDATLPERYVTPGENRRRTDRLIWTGLGRMPVEEEDLATIVVEFVSKSKRDWLRDYEEKRAEYLALGVAEYWVIDRFRYTMTVFRKSPSEPAEQTLDATATYRTPLLPGFELPLAHLFAVADKWKGPKLPRD
jgi:Uma2 family endonuclease